MKLTRAHVGWLGTLTTTAALTTVLGCIIQTGTFPEGRPTGANNGAGNNGDVNNGTNNGGTNNGQNNSSNNGVADTYSDVLLEDLSPALPEADAPGADIDAVAIEHAGEEFWVEEVVDFIIGGASNAFGDPTRIVGSPDSACLVQGFTSLGGIEAGSFVILSFGDAALVSGDRIVVYELGPTLCPDQPEWAEDTEEVTIGVSARSADSEEWIELGTLSEGSMVIELP